MSISTASETLRQKLLGEAHQLVHGLDKDPGILAALLTGSAAWGKPNPEGDLDIILITEHGPGVLYRYLIPTFCPVTRRSELGHLPIDEATSKIDEAFSTSISCSIIEQFKHARILFQRHSHGDMLVDRCRRVGPSKAHIGKMIGEVSTLARALDTALSDDRSCEAILASRQLVRLAAQILLIGLHRVGIAKEKQEFPAIRRSLSGREVERFATVLSVDQITPAKSRLAVTRAIDLVRGLLKTRSVNPALVEYGEV